MFTKRENPPAECPQCHAPASKFVEIKDEGGKPQWACEHHIGDGRVEDKEVVQGLKDHFNGECTEVGMYLAMSRQAEREGYPEIAEALQEVRFRRGGARIQVRRASRRRSLGTPRPTLRSVTRPRPVPAKRKLAIATRAKQLGYDAIHDTVHEMAKDEARHGAGFYGLLTRYFGK